MLKELIVYSRAMEFGLGETIARTSGSFKMEHRTRNFEFRNDLRNGAIAWRQPEDRLTYVWQVSSEISAVIDECGEPSYP